MFLLNPYAFGAAPPAPPDTGSILDTFTAADDTDPTTRDLDAYPEIPGTNRWRNLNTIYDNGFETWYPYMAGRIEGNALALTDTTYTITTGAWAPSSHIVPGTRLWLFGDDGDEGANGAGAQLLLSSFPYFILMVGNPGTTTMDTVFPGSIDLAVQSDGPDYAEVTIFADGSYEGQVYTAGVGYFDQTLTGLSAGAHKIGLFVESDAVSLIMDGSVVASTGDIGAAAVLNVAIIQVRPNQTTGLSWSDTGGSIDKVAIYDSASGIDLTAAIALTA